MHIPFIVVNYVPDQSEVPKGVWCSDNRMKCRVISKENFAAYGDITILKKMLQRNILPEDDIFDILGKDGVRMQEVLQRAQEVKHSLKQKYDQGGNARVGGQASLVHSAFHQ